MRKSRNKLSPLTLFFAAAMLTVTSQAQAQSPQVFVSAEGSDSGSCTTGLPCRTVSYALTQVQTGGKILIVASGDYDNSITIDKSVTVAAAPGVVAVFSNAQTNGSIVYFAPGPAFCRSTECFTVVFRNLVFDGQSVTQDAMRGAFMRLIVEDCTFSRFKSGFYANGDGTYQFTNCVFQLCDTGLFLASNNADSPRTLLVIVDSCHFESLTAVGVDVYPGLNITAKVSVRNTLINRAATIGIRGTGAAGGTAQINVDGTHITNCTTGIYTFSAGTLVRVSNSTIVANSRGLLPQSGQLLSRSNNTVEDNGFNGSFTGTFLAK